MATFTHTFTHFKLHITPLRAEAEDVWLDVGEAIPTPVRSVLQELTRRIHTSSL